MPLIWISIFFFGGILAADQVPGSILLWLAVGIIGSCLAFLVFCLTFRNKRNNRSHRLLPVFLITAFTCGAIRYQSSLPNFSDPNFLIHYLDRGRPIQIQGLVAGFPDQQDADQNLIVEASLICLGDNQPWISLKGRILARVHPEHNVHYGDRISLTGYLNSPPEGEDFNYREYLERKGVYGMMNDPELAILEQGGGFAFLRWIYGLREYLLDRVYRIWPDPEASLLAGILLGIESGIPIRVEEAFRQTGTSHIIAISGFNITIVAGLVTRLAGRFFNPRRGALVAAVGITLYTILVGADPAVVRAALMGGMSLFAQQIGRRQHGLIAAALASLLMAVHNPQIPWDLSFQLSLAATLGLIFYADPITNGFVQITSRVIRPGLVARISDPISEFILVTFAAQLTTFPVMIFHFQTFSLNTFLANPVILPVQPPIMIMGGLALILGGIWLPLGKLAAPLVFPFVTFTIRIVEWFSGLPIRTFSTGDNSAAAAVIYCLALGLVTVLIQWDFPLGLWLEPSGTVSALFVAVLLIWRVWFCLPDGELKLTFCDVGPGTAILIQTQRGSRILINGGPSTSALADCLGRRLPPFSRRLDWLVIAAPTDDEIGGLERNLDRYPPEQVLWIGEKNLGREPAYLEKAIGDKELPLFKGKCGSELVMDGEVRMEIVDLSDRGGTLLLTYKRFKALLPFGLTAEVRNRLRQGAEIGSVSVLLAADGGYAPGNPPEWIANLHPQLVILSTGGDQFRNQIDPILLENLAGYSLLRTDQQGCIRISTDGIEMDVTVERIK